MGKSCIVMCQRLVVGILDLVGRREGWGEEVGRGRGGEREESEDGIP